MTEDRTSGENGPVPKADSGAPQLTAEVRASVDRRLRMGVGLSAVGAVVATVGFQVGLWDGLGLSLFYLLLPSLAVAQLPLLKAGQIERIPVYVGSAATILVIGFIALGLGLRGGSAAGVGLVWIPGWEMAAWTAAGTIAGLAIIGAFQPIGSLTDGEAYRLVLQLIPRTGPEKRVFVILSLIAGLGEEIAYRGYALFAIQLLIPGAWTAALLSSAAFGALHAYQGLLGVARTALIGLALAVPVLLTESVVPGIISHALIDLVAGFVVGPRMLAKARESGGFGNSSGAIPGLESSGE